MRRNKPRHGCSSDETARPYVPEWRHRLNDRPPPLHEQQLLVGHSFRNRLKNSDKNSVRLHYPSVQLCTANIRERCSRPRLVAPVFASSASASKVNLRPFHVLMIVPLGPERYGAVNARTRRAESKKSVAGYTGTALSRWLMDDAYPLGKPPLARRQRTSPRSVSSQRRMASDNRAGIGCTKQRSDPRSLPTLRLSMIGLLDCRRHADCRRAEEDCAGAASSRNPHVFLNRLTE